MRHKLTRCLGAAACPHPLHARADTLSRGSIEHWDAHLAALHVYAARAVGIPARVVGAPCWNGGEFAGLARDNQNVSKCWHGGVGNTTGGGFLDNHNWLEFWDDVEKRWVTSNDPGTGVGNMCGGDVGSPHGCGWNNVSGCSGAHHLSAAMRDHEIISVTWEHADDSGTIPVK